MGLIGGRIRRLRTEAELTQLEFGGIFGVANSTVSQWESEVNEPDAATLTKIAERFHVSLDWLMGRTDVREEKRSNRPNLVEMWPNLSPNRRERALTLQAFLGKRGHVGRDWDDATFDLFEAIVLTTAKSLDQAQKKET